MRSRKQNFNVSTSLENKKKLHKKINEHIAGIIRKNNSSLNVQRNITAEKIPQKIIFKTKQTHKYLYKKSLINTKFQWLNKYVQNTELQSLPLNIDPNNFPRPQKTNRFQNKQNEIYHLDHRKQTFNRRSRTQATQDQCQEQQFAECKKERRFFGQRKSEPEVHLRHLQQINLNIKISSEKNFKVNRSKCLKDRKSIFEVANDHLKHNLLRQRNQQVSNRSNLMKKDFSFSNDTERMQNKNNSKRKNGKNLKIFIDENTPTKEFLDNTARLNSSNLIFKNTSGYIKNRKRQYIYQSREQKRQQSQLLKMKRRFEQQITVEPWNPKGNDNENQEHDFPM